MFVDEGGAPLLPQRLTKMFATAIARVDVPKIRLHDVRHTMATTTLGAGVHPKVVQEQLGHASSSSLNGHLCLIGRTTRRQTILSAFHYHVYVRQDCPKWST